MKKKRDEDLETPFQVFKRNYKNVKGVRYFTRLFLYFFFIFIFFIASMVIARLSGNTSSTNKETKAPVVNEVKTYKEILESSKNKSISITIFEGDINYIVDVDIHDNVLTGTIENNDGIKKFKIENDIIYETKLQATEENMSLFNNIDYKLFNINNLIDQLENNVGTKQVKNDYIIYNYSNLDNYNIEVVLEDNRVNIIKVNNDSIKYEITIK